MYYLDHPDIGGATVFPLIGIRIKALRKSAVFWFNMHSSGDGDIRTLHVIPAQRILIDGFLEIYFLRLDVPF